MPVNVITSWSKRYKIPKKDLESKWKKAKKASTEQGKKGNFAYTTAIFKRMTAKDKQESHREIRSLIMETQVGGGDKAYKKFIQDKLDEIGVSDIGDLSDEQKKEFFKSVDQEWEADDERKHGESDSEDYPTEESFSSLRSFILENLGEESPEERMDDEEEWEDEDGSWDSEEESPDMVDEIDIDPDMEDTDDDDRGTVEYKAGSGKG